MLWVPGADRELAPRCSMNLFRFMAAPEVVILNQWYHVLRLYSRYGPSITIYAPHCRQPETKIRVYRVTGGTRVSLFLHPVIKHLSRICMVGPLTTIIIIWHFAFQFPFIKKRWPSEAVTDECRQSHEDHRHINIANHGTVVAASMPIGLIFCLSTGMEVSREPAGKPWDRLTSRQSGAPSVILSHERIRKIRGCV